MAGTSSPNGKQYYFFTETDKKMEVAAKSKKTGAASAKDKLAE